MKLIFFSQNLELNKIANPKKIDKNNGIIISANGIKDLKTSSCVKDIEIQ